MARHKKMEFEDDADPSMDISSLIDCCFLLLIYFIVATSIVQERKLDMSMPGQAPSSSSNNAIEPGLIRVDNNGVIYWGKQDSQVTIDSDPENHELPSLVENLNNLRQAAEAIGSKPVVQLYVENGAKHQRVVDVLNALSRADIKSVALTNVPEDQ